MKHNILYIAAIALCAAFAVTSCADDEVEAPDYNISLEVTSDSPLLVQGPDAGSGSVRFKTKGGELSLDVLTNQKEWTYTNSNPDWLSVEETEFGLLISAGQNMEEVSPSSTLVISTGYDERIVSYTLEVSQNYYGQPEISVSEMAHNFPALGGEEMSVVLDVDTNLDEWSFECSCPWLLVETTDTTVTLKAEPNPLNTQRDMKLTLIAGRGDKTASETVSVTQDGIAYIKLDSRSVATDYEGTVGVINVTSNPELPWDVVKGDESWFKVEKDGNSVKFTIDPASDKIQRSATVSFTVGYGENTASMTADVYQIGEDTQELIYEIEVTKDGVTAYDAVVGTGSGYASGIDVDIDWGDGTPVKHYTDVRPTHEFAKAGIYIVKVKGVCNNLSFGTVDNGTTVLAKKVISWGVMGYTLANTMCKTCENLTEIPNDVAGSFSEVTTFDEAFFNTPVLKAIPPRLFYYATKATKMTETFCDAASISEIPADLFVNCTAVTDFTGCFYECGTGSLVLHDAFTTDEIRDYLAKNGKLKSIPGGLFRNCDNAKSFSYAFRGTAITTFPADLFEGVDANGLDLTELFHDCALLESAPLGFFRPNMTGVKRLFQNCASLKTVPAGFFENCDNVTIGQEIFYGSGIETLPAGIFKPLTKITSLYGMFKDCANLKEVDPGIFEGMSLVTNGQYMFEGCTSLNTVPQGLFKDCVKMYQFNYMFNKSGLETVPEDLFSYGDKTKAGTFNYCFAESKIKSVPAGLFAGWGAVTTGFQYLFRKSAIESIPAGLFDDCVKATSFNNLCLDCVNLKQIPGGLFPSSTTGVTSAFQGCTSLEVIPADLFSKCLTTKVIAVSSMFQGCTSLKSVPAGLFDNLVKSSAFTYIFRYCENLADIPAGLFSKNVNLTSMAGIFNGCSALTSLPEGIFDANIKVTNFSYAFANCFSLKTLPEGLFAKNTKVTNFSYVFDGCTDLTGESPYNLDGETKVHLYERGNYATTVYSKISSYSSAFKGCTGLSDYGSIPTNWK
ncbi:MAG: BACON domain-containing protein [Candidatus Cryptobacteroides sp.]